jgi:hypothetical protein
MSTYPPLSRLLRESPALKRGPKGRVRHWRIAGLVMLLCTLALAVVAAGPGTEPGDITMARAVQRPTSGMIDAVAEVFSLIGADYP